VNVRMSLEELRPHLHSLPKQPTAIPYRTAYYSETWGFCLADEQLRSLSQGDYDVFIDSTLENGTLTYGELLIPGETSDEVLVSTHICHPSLCNDNLSGIAVATLLAAEIRDSSPHYSYRFIFIPGTIGSIVWLARNEVNVSRIKHGLVLTGVGDSGTVTYKKSRRGNSVIDRAAAEVLRASGDPYTIVDFHPYGYDERQFCSPGFNLPVGCFMRTPHGQYSEYHTSLDNLSFVSRHSLSDSLIKLGNIVDVVDSDRCFYNTNSKCEPHLGKRGLYRPIGGQSDEQWDELALLWVLNYSDGQHSLLDIAEKSQIPFQKIAAAATVLRKAALLEPAPYPPASPGA
jgi:aminopeptidase-like protein